MRRHFLRRSATGDDTMTTDKTTGSMWAGFSCKRCGAPLAVEQFHSKTTSVGHATRGWNITCTHCGIREYYQPGTPMVRITIPG
jgi:hypothetical protein